jgi:hypothetical protein
VFCRYSFPNIAPAADGIRVFEPTDRLIENRIIREPTYESNGRAVEKRKTEGMSDLGKVMWDLCGSWAVSGGAEFVSG